MAKKTHYTVTAQQMLAPNVYRVELSGDTSAITRPGQFVDLKLPDFYLRRPISVCDWSEGRLTLIYKVVGHGTEAMTTLPVGTELDTLSGLGNGYDLSLAGDHPVVVGGGVGIPPLYALARELRAAGHKVTAVLGFNTAEEQFLVEEFKALGCEVKVTTVDGTAGIQGFVTAALTEDYSHVFTCGPEPMLKAVYNALPCGGQFSFEERMGCGYGACMGCSCQTKYGAKRICKDGPVLMKEEIVW